MKILKTILFIFLGLIALVFLVAAFIDGKTQYEKSVVINAPVEKVWVHINSIKAFDTWNPWNDKDPQLIKTHTGTPGQRGEKQCWESKKEEVGKGCITLAEANPATHTLIADMKFLTPYESEARETVTLVPEGGTTKATWQFSSEIPYPFRILKLFMNLEEMVGPDYQKGLNRLKELSEKP